MSDATNHRDVPGDPGSPVPLADLLRSWVADGLITSEQEREIRQHTSDRTPVRTPAAQAARSPLLVETLGYLGGLVVLIASILLTARYWSQLSTDFRMALVAGAAAVLLGAGFATPRGPGAVGTRLRSVLLLTSTVAFGGFLALLGQDSWQLHDDKATLLIAGGSLAYAVGLWALHRTALQQVVAVLLSLATAAALVSVLTTGAALPGVAIWGAAAVWFLLAWGGVVPHRRLVEVVAAIGTVVGAVIMMAAETGQDAALAFGLVNAAVLVGLALLFRDLILLAVGAVASLVAIPSAVGHWFPESIVVPLALLLVGVLLVGAALATARRRTQAAQSAQPEPDHSVGSRRPALLAAVAVTVAVTAFIAVVSTS